MVSLFYARRYPAGRELSPSDQSVPNDKPVLDTNGPSSTVNDSQPSDVPPTGGVPAPSDNTNPSPTPTDVPPTTPIAPSPDVPATPNVSPQPTVVPDLAPTPSELPPITTITLTRDPLPSESTTFPGQNQDSQPPPSPTPVPNPSPNPSPPPGKPTPSPVDNGPTPASSGSPDSNTQEYVPASSTLQSASGCFVSPSVPNNPRPMSTQTLRTGSIYTPNPPGSSSTIISTPDLPASSTVSLSTETLQPTPTAVLTQGGSLSAASSSNKKYIIGGAAGGGALVLILLLLLLFCCRKRRAKKDVERSDDGHSGGQSAHGQFTCCNHGTCTRNNGQPHMEQKTPLKPFILKSNPAALTPKEGQRQPAVSLNRRDSTESQKSAGSDASSGTVYSDSEGSQRGRRRSQKRPPPLKLTSLVTPVIHGPQYNLRNRADRVSLPNPHGVPSIVVEPPQSETPDRMKRY